MTREEAIERFENHAQYYLDYEDICAIRFLINELENSIPKKKIDLTNKCGSCVYAVPFKTTVGDIKCTNPILEMKRTKVISSLKQRTARACKQYEMRAEVEYDG